MPRGRQAQRIVAAIILVIAVMAGVGITLLWGSWTERDNAVNQKQAVVSSAATLSSVGQQVIDIAAEQQRVIQELSKLCAHTPVPRDLEPACQKASVIATQSLPTGPAVTQPIPSLTVVTVTTVHPETVPFTILVIGSTTITSRPPAVVVTSTIKGADVTQTAVVTSVPEPVTAVVVTTQTNVVPTTAVLTITEDGVVTTSTAMTTETLTLTQSATVTETPPPNTETQTNTATVTVTQDPGTVTITVTPQTTETDTTTATETHTETVTETQTTAETTTETSTVVVLPPILGG